MAILDAVFADRPGQTPQDIERRRRMAQELLAQSASDEPIRSPWQGVAKIAQALMGGYEEARADKDDASNRSAANKALIDAVYGGSSDAAPSFNSQAAATSSPGSRSRSAGNVDPSIREGIVQTASSLGIDPVDLATAISYETAGTFDPRKKGPTTQWGQHEGLIQFGEPQAKKYGVDWSNPVGSQLGENGAVANYLRDTGVKPGMGLLDIYSAINAGGVGRYGASDANNGGAPGTVADKVNNQMAGHRQKALALIGEPQQVASLDPSIGRPEAAAAIQRTAPGSGRVAPQGAQQASGLRPFRAGETRPNADGSYSTEITTTWQLPSGEWVNVPSLWMGPNGPQQFKPEDEQGILGAMQSFEAQNGQTFQRYRSAQEAEQAAKQRSSAGGAGAGPQTVSALPVPPNAQPMPQGIPAEFAGSQQLANAQGGIVPALMGGTAASPEQIAQARALGEAQPQPQPQGQDNRALIATLLGNPYTAEAGQQLLMQEMKSRQDMQNAAREEQLWRQRQDYEAQQRQADPAYKMGLEKNRLEIDTLRNPQGFRQLTPQEIAQRGLDPTKQYQIGKDDKVSQIGDSGTNVSVTMGGEPSDNNLRKKLDEKTGELWSTYQEQGATSAAAAQDFGVLDELIKVAPQGPIQGRLAEMFPGVSSAGDAFQSIVKRVAPTLRAPGSGATSDIEYDGMLKSLPALRNKPEANQAINAVMKAKAAINVERSSVIDQYGRGEITAGEARSKIAEIDKKSIMSPELKKALEGIGATSDSNATPTVGEVIDGYRFKGGDPADQNSWERQ